MLLALDGASNFPPNQKLEYSMKLLPTLIAAVFAAASFSALAADAVTAAAPVKTEAAAPKKMTAQQEKMKACNMTAKEKALKGPDRKAFMKACLKKGKKDSAAPAAK
ncbi:MAG: PsiF family protein [Gallionellaceae bacterium]|nr:PsiF family protein [Gallionellaceae bacterium]